MSCNHNCNTCKSDCGSREVVNPCPICNSEGYLVPNETIVSLMKSPKEITGQHYLCTSRSCDVIYFNNDKKIYTNYNITKPIWYKSTFDEYIVCYCRNIKLQDIVEVVYNEKGKVTKEDVIRILGKENIKTDCLHNFPTGETCDQLFDSALNFAIRKYFKEVNK